MTITTTLPTDLDGLSFAGPGGKLPAGDAASGADYTPTHVRSVALSMMTSTPTLSVAGAYATGDYVGPSTTPASFSFASRAAGTFGRIRSLVIVDKQTAAAVAMELWLFYATFTAPIDNATEFARL